MAISFLFKFDSRSIVYTGVIHLEATRGRIRKFVENFKALLSFIRLDSFLSDYFACPTQSAQSVCYPRVDTSTGIRRFKQDLDSFGHGRWI